MWYLKLEYTRKDGKHVEQTNRIPVLDSVKEEVSAAFSEGLTEMLDQCIEDLRPDMVITVTYLGLK